MVRRKFGNELYLAGVIGNDVALAVVDHAAAIAGQVTPLPCLPGSPARVRDNGVKRADGERLVLAHAVGPPGLASQRRIA